MAVAMRYTPSNGNALAMRPRVFAHPSGEYLPSPSQHIMSRRGFCLCCMAATTVAVSGGCLTPRQAFAKARNIVELIRYDTAKDAIDNQKRRRSVRILD